MCLESIYDPYVTHDEVRRKDSDGYDLPNETESVTLRKICNSSSSKTAYYDDTINCDSALTPQQLKNRKRASLKIQQSEDLVYESCTPDLRVKPNPPPKPLGLKVRRQNTVMHKGNYIPPVANKPLNETILSKEFPEIPEEEISVILSISSGNLKEARKDVKFKIFRDKMQHKSHATVCVLLRHVEESVITISRLRERIIL